MTRLTQTSLNELVKDLKEFFPHPGDFDRVMQGHPIQKRLKSGRWKDIPKSHVLIKGIKYKTDPNIIYVNDIGERFEAKDKGYYYEVTTGKLHDMIANDCDSDDYGPINNYTGLYKTASGALYGYKAYYEMFPEEKKEED